MVSGVPKSSVRRTIIPANTYTGPEFCPSLCLRCHGTYMAPIECLIQCCLTVSWTLYEQTWASWCKMQSFSFQKVHKKTVCEMLTIFFKLRCNDWRNMWSILSREHGEGWGEVVWAGMEEVVRGSITLVLLSVLLMLSVLAQSYDFPSANNVTLSYMDKISRFLTNRRNTPKRGSWTYLGMYVM